MTIELDSTLAQAEVLYLSFAQLVADIDQKQAENKIEGLRRRVGAENKPSQNLPIISDNLRELLRSDHR